MSDSEITHERVRANGIDFHVAACGSGDRLALCLHGFPESWYSWRDQLPLLARLGYRAWAPDLRGYGDTERPTRLQDYAIEKLEQDVAGLVDASGARSVVLIAHDWGGVIAWNVAIYRIRKLDRLIILNMPHPARFREGLRTARQLRRSWYIAFFQIPRLPEIVLGARGAAPVARLFRVTTADPSRFPASVLEMYRKNAARPGALTAMLAYYRAIGRGGGSRRIERRGTPMLHTPTLLVWGDRDTALGSELADGTDHYVKQLTLRHIPEASHWVQQDAPETVNRMIEAFLTDRPVPES